MFMLALWKTWPILWAYLTTCLIFVFYFTRTSSPCTWPGTVLSTLQILTHLIHIKKLCGIYITVPISQMGKLKSIDVKQLAEGHQEVSGTVRMWSQVTWLQRLVSWSLYHLWRHSQQNTAAISHWGKWDLL